MPMMTQSTDELAGWMPVMTQPEVLAPSLEPARTIIRRLNGPQPEHLARRIVTEAMTTLGAAGELPDVEMVVNELVTNARQHAPRPYELRVFVRRASVKIGVLDGGIDCLPVARRLRQAGVGAPADAESGRGLQIVTGLFPGSCGVEPAATCTGMALAKQVWITLPLPRRDEPGPLVSSDARIW
jgi:anti-sigma regulatory factor (Ser/Thr protein kinase)